MDAARRFSSLIDRVRGALTPARAGAPGPGPPHPPAAALASPPAAPASPPAAPAPPAAAPASPAAAPASSPVAPASPPSAPAGAVARACDAATAHMASAPSHSPGLLRRGDSAVAWDSRTSRAGSAETRRRRLSRDDLPRGGVKRYADEGKGATRKRARSPTGRKSGGRNSSENVSEDEERGGQLGRGIYSIFRGVEQAAVAVPPTRVLSPVLSFANNGAAAVDTIQGAGAVGGASGDAGNGEKGGSALNAPAGESARIAAGADKEKSTDAVPQRIALSDAEDLPDTISDRAAEERTGSGRGILEAAVRVDKESGDAREGAVFSQARRANTVNDEEVQEVDGEGDDGEGADDSGSSSSNLSSCKLSELSDGASSASSSLAGGRAEGDRAEGDRVEGDRAEGDRAEGDRAEGDRPASRRRTGFAPVARAWTHGVQYQNMSPLELAEACRTYAESEAAAGRPVVPPLPDWSRYVAVPIEGRHLRVVANRRRKRVLRSFVAGRGGGGNAAGGGGPAAHMPDGGSGGPGQGPPPAGY